MEGRIKDEVLLKWQIIMTTKKMEILLLSFERIVRNKGMLTRQSENAQQEHYKDRLELWSKQNDWYMWEFSEARRAVMVFEQKWA